MSTSILDTAELPATLPAARVTPVEDIGVDVSGSRVTRRRERQQLRRQRRLYALGSVAALVSFLGVTIYIVDVVR